MFSAYRFVILMFFAVLLCSCHPSDKYPDRFWVVSNSANIHARPDATSKVIKGLKLGADVYCNDKNPDPAVPKEWIAASSGEARGFMERKGIISGGDLSKEIEALTDGAEKQAVQGTGLTKGKVFLKLKPEKGAFVIEQLKGPEKVDILERVIVTTGEKEKATRQLWYKIRLDNGHVGFITSNNIGLTPPRALGAYTDVRTPVSWYKLNDNDYLVTYSSVGSDIGIDFTRVELYTYDPKTESYSTSLAKSGLYGKLPLNIIDAENGGKIIEIQENPKGDKTKIHWIKYSFPSPIKIVKEYVEGVGEK